MGVILTTYKSWDDPPSRDHNVYIIKITPKVPVHFASHNKGPPVQAGNPMAIVNLPHRNHVHPPEIAGLIKGLLTIGFSRNKAGY